MPPSGAYYIDTPDDLAVAQNGRLAPSLLTSVPGGGSCHRVAAGPFIDMKRAFDVYPAHANRGYQLSYTGVYRSYTRQVALFYERYAVSPNGSCSGCNGRRCEKWGGKVWCLKPGVAGAAVPGTSNHGWGLAFDFAIRTETGELIGIGPGVAWLRANAGHYGFVNEVQSENWHWTYVYGDQTPPYRVPPPPPIEEEVMATAAEVAKAVTDEPISGPPGGLGPATLEQTLYEMRVYIRGLDAKINDLKAAVDKLVPPG